MISAGFRAEAFLLSKFRENGGVVSSSAVIEEADFFHGISAPAMRAAARRFARPVRDGSIVYWMKKEGADSTWITEQACRRQIVWWALGGDPPERSFMNVFRSDEERDIPWEPPIDGSAQRPPWHDDNVVPLRDGDKKDTLE